jgi:DNA-binding IclR family transcriptional regulator
MARVATGESSLARAVRILDSFTPDERALTVAEIARRSGLHVATASRLIAELVAHGLLSRDEDRQVRIGVRMWELAERASPTLSLRSAALPYLGDLRAVVGHHAQLCVVDGEDVLCLERLSSPDAVLNYTRVAGRLPFHATSAGIILLAHGPDDLTERVLARPLSPFTAHTMTTPRQVRDQLATARRQGFALLRGHYHEGVVGVTVPVRGGMGDVVAGLSVIVPNDDRACMHVPVLQAAARGLERVLRMRRGSP